MRQRAPEPVRPGRDDPDRHSGRRHLPTPGPRPGRRRHGRASEASPSTSTVSEASVVKIDDDLPLSRACLLGCGVMTGWGSAVNTADVAPGDTVVVIGCGGIGSGAIQGARLAGAEQIVVVEHRGSQAGQGLRVRRHALRDIDARSDRTGRRTHPRGDGRLRAADHRPAGGSDDQRGAGHRPQGRCGGDDRHRLDGRRHADAADGVDDAVSEATAGQPLRRGQSARRHSAATEPLPRRQAASRRDGHQRVQTQRHQRGATTTCSPAATSAA